MGVIMLYGSCYVLSVEPTCTRGWGRGVVGRLIVVLFQPLWLLLREVLTQITEVESGEVLMEGGGVKDLTWSLWATVTEASIAALQSIQLQSIQLQSIQLQSIQLQSIKLQSIQLQSIQL